MHKHFCTADLQSVMCLQELYRSELRHGRDPCGSSTHSKKIQGSSWVQITKSSLYAHNEGRGGAASKAGAPVTSTKLKHRHAYDTHVHTHTHTHTYFLSHTHTSHTHFSNLHSNRYVFSLPSAHNAPRLTLALINI